MVALTSSLDEKVNASKKLLVTPPGVAVNLPLIWG
jgi:hypothetical protein